jgi:hypothetical protein
MRVDLGIGGGSEIPKQYRSRANLLGCGPLAIVFFSVFFFLFFYYC